MGIVFFTGFPGFLGGELLPHVLDRRPEDEAVCLVQPKFMELARGRADALMAAAPGRRGRIRLVEGDITRPDLGLAPGAVPAEDVVEIYHLAAVYDLAVREDLAVAVNVDGTRHLLDFAERSPKLERFQYVSTCYVAGDYVGPFGEDDLEKGQGFLNYYEETKHLAEVEVRARMAKGLPATIYRPAVVVGDSRTGATQKYDGPYFVMQWLLRQPKVAVLPAAGNPKLHRVNLVPQDFVIQAIAYLSGQEKSAGKCYQLADHRPLTVDEMIDVLGRATGRRILRVPLPLRVAKGAIRRVPGVYQLMRIPAEAVDYFVHPGHFLTQNTRTDLAEAGIEVPDFRSYVDRLVEYMKAHPEVSSAAMA